jgi:transposase
MTNTTIGIDVSKERLDAHRPPDGASAGFENDRAGIGRMIRWIGEGVTRIVYEPTGSYHRAMERQLGDAGYPLFKVNPRQARHFAEALGILAKTDRTDAAMLTRMGCALELEARPQKAAVLHDLNDLYLARRALVKDRTAAMNRAKRRPLSLLKRQNAARFARNRRMSFCGRILTPTKEVSDGTDALKPVHSSSLKR